MTYAMKKLLHAESFEQANFVFSQNTASGWTLSTALAAMGITKKARITITVNAGINVGMLTIDSAPAGSRIKLINNGNIIGNSGSGTALVVNIKTRIINNGMIAGGGGHGGAGGAGQHGGLNSNRACEVGTVSAGNGGRGAGMVGTQLVTATGGSTGGSASDSAARGGTGGAGGELGQPGMPGGAGIKGNSWGGGNLADANGQSQYYPACGAYNGGIYQTGAPGGVAGKAIQGMSFVTLETRGNIVGPTA